MQIEWKDQPVPTPPLPEGFRAVQAEAVAPADCTDLRAALFVAAQRLGGDLVRQGASPGHIKTLAIKTADPGAFEADLRELGLRFREALGGNMGDVALIGSQGPLTLNALALVPPQSDDTVFGPYTVDELNRQYSPRSSVPEAGDIMAQWRVDGIAYQENRTAELIFGDTAEEGADLYMPDGTDPPPLHVFIHGGYWQALSKRDNAQLTEALVQAGIAVAVVEYPLAPPAKVGEIIQTCQKVIAGLYRSAGSHGYDSQRITISGHSAGGHLVAEMAATDWPALGADLPVDLIKGTVAISGLFDLEPLRHTGLNNALRMDAAEAAALSPLTRPIRATGPYVAAVGGAESDEFRRQSRDFADRKTAEGTEVSYLELPGLNHFTVVEALNDPASPLFQAAWAMSRQDDAS